MDALLDHLLVYGPVPVDDLRRAADHAEASGVPLASVLLDLGLLDERGLAAAAAAQAGLPFADLATSPADPRAAEALPPGEAERLGVLPVAVRDGALVVAVADPAALPLADEVARLSGRRVEPALAARGALDDAIGRYVRAARVVERQEPAPEPAVGAAPSGAPAPPAGRARTEEPEVRVTVTELLEAMLEAGASDLHLSAGARPAVRVHGRLEQVEPYPVLQPGEIRAMVYSILTQRQREKLEGELELDCAHTLPGRARFRLNVYRQRGSVGAAFRVIPVDIKPLEDLGIPPQVAGLARLPRGFVLVTGPTGSGKSTTLASLVDLANRERSDHIMTVEDPIEFLHTHKRCLVNQREVQEDTRSFASALKHVLRQDPDIILVGEMRDLETISIALTGAETGHLVFATLHTQDAPQTIDRVIDVFPTNQQQQVRVQLAGTLQGVVCQQLVPTADGSGRAVAVEVMMATPAIRNLIREGKTHQVYSAMQAGGRHGMQTMDQSLADLVRRYRISYDLGLERCHHVEDFNRLCGRAQ
jgi:twitching motility protein PilT